MNGNFHTSPYKMFSLNLTFINSAYVCLWKKNKKTSDEFINYYNYKNYIKIILVLFKI